MPTAMIQVIRVAINPTPAPAATGRRRTLRSPTMLAVIAERTRMHSSPSRKTSTAMSSMATVLLVCGCVGSGEPWAVTPCQINTPVTIAAATKRKILNPTDLAVFELLIRSDPWRGERRSSAFCISIENDSQLHKVNRYLAVFFLLHDQTTRHP